MLSSELLYPFVTQCYYEHCNDANRDVQSLSRPPTLKERDAGMTWHDFYIKSTVEHKALHTLALSEPVIQEGEFSARHGFVPIIVVVRRNL